MDRAPSPSAPLRTESPEEPTALSRSWVMDGIVAGLLGAGVIALVFLGFDLLAGRPLWTPTVLGALLFLGEQVGSDAAPVPALVVGYTAFHGTVFVSGGLAASYVMLGNQRQLGPRAGLATAAILFVAFEAIILSFSAVLDADLVGSFGGGRIAIANLLAAGSMAAVLVRGAATRRRTDEA